MPGEFSSKQNLLFDLDGTLIDSEGAHARAYIAALRLHDPSKAEAFDYAAVAGQPSPQVFGSLGFLGEALKNAVSAKQSSYRQMIEAGEIAVFPEVEDALGRLEDSGRKLFLVTGASRLSVQTLLQRLDLQRFFRGVVVGEDTRQGKPHPEPYLLALKKFSLDPAMSLAIEDSENGARSAQQAGLDCVLMRSTAVLDHVPALSDFMQLVELLAA